MAASLHGLPGLPGASARPGKRNLERPALVCVLLALSVLAAYLAFPFLGFTNYDDPSYVTTNPVVQAGLRWRGLAWAFINVSTGNWHPMTWVSHILDCQIYGLEPGGHHLTSLLIHTANSVILFLWLRFVTAGFWRSAV